MDERTRRCCEEVGRDALAAVGGGDEEARNAEGSGERGWVAE
jgi:hypothetical protein